MNFTQNNTSFKPVHLETSHLPNESVSQYPYPFPMNEIQRQMYCLYEQNRYLQYQLLQQKLAYFRSQQESEKNFIMNIKMEEAQKQLQQPSKTSSNEETNKCIQQTSAASRYIFKRENKIKKSKTQKNETKNIPKNYGKAIVSFIENNKELVRRVLSKFSQMSYTCFMNILRSKKNKINSIADLRSFWLEDDQQEFPKVARILSNIFLRHFSLQYIFNSRISNFSGHVKYRARLIEALRNPKHFTSIKQY